MKRTILIITCLLLTGLAQARAQDASESWEKNCRKCHGPDGKGDTKMGKKVEVKDYTDAAVQAAAKDEEMFKAIKEGVKAKDTGKNLMKGFGDVLTEDENKAFVPYIRAFKK